MISFSRPQKDIVSFSTANNGLTFSASGGRVINNCTEAKNGECANLTDLGTGRKELSLSWIIILVLKQATSPDWVEFLGAFIKTS